MPSQITPMVHVPDVSEAARWYAAIGFTLAGWHACDADGLSNGPMPADAELDWALLRWGDGRVMLSSGGTRSDARRRGIDLYIDLNPASPDEGVDALFARLKDKAEVIEAPYDAFHGNRELILRDPNGFWLTFAEPVKAAGI